MQSGYPSARRKTRSLQEEEKIILITAEWNFSEVTDRDKIKLISIHKSRENVYIQLLCTFIPAHRSICV